MKKTLTKRTIKLPIKPLTNFRLAYFILIGLSLVASPKTQAKPYAKAFRVKYDSVWKGVLIALTKYPLEKNDKSTGEISTSIIENDQVFKPFNRAIKMNEQYKLFVNIEKRKLNGQRAVVVKIEKKPLLKGNFMNKDRELKSDGIEENILLYRISREIRIDHAVEKLFK